MNQSRHGTGKFHLHQHPLIYIGIFLVLALGALLITVFSAGEDDVAPAGGTRSEVTAERSEFCTAGQTPPFDVAEIEGRSLADAEAWAEANGYLIRPIVVDGEPRPATADYRENRANVQVDNGTISYFCSMG